MKYPYVLADQNTAVSDKMAPTQENAAAASTGDSTQQPVPMEVEGEVIDVLSMIAAHVNLTPDMLRSAVHKSPGELFTTGDIAALGQMFRTKVLVTDSVAASRRAEAEEDALRRRTEMATQVDHAEESNALFNELFPLETCIPTDSRYMGKQISSLAAKLREKQKAGGLRMDSALDWVRTRRELEETFRDARIGTNEKAKCWLAFEVASPSTRTNLKDLGLIKFMRENPDSARYNDHFVQPQNQCFKVLSQSGTARNSIYRLRPQQASHEDVSAWHRRLVAIGTEAFGDVEQWTREDRSAVTDCFIRKSRHPQQLEMHVDRTKLESARASDRADQLDALSRLCGETTPGERDAHPLDDYHLTHVEPAGATLPPTSLAADAGSDARSRPWAKRGNRRYPDRPPRTTEPVNWIKRDGKCAQCNQPNDHPQPCTRPKVCWTCNSPDHCKDECPTRAARPAGGRGKAATRGPRKAAVHQVQHHWEPAPSVGGEGPAEGLYSVVPSSISSVAATPGYLAYDLIAPTKGRIRSIFGIAGLWDSGCQTSNHVIMNATLFRRLFGEEKELMPYTGVRIEGATGDSLLPKGEVDMKLAISGLPALKPTPVRVLVCDNVGQELLIGRQAITRWDVSVRYYDKGETWKAGNQSVEAMTRLEAQAYNRGLTLGDDVPPGEWAQTSTLFNRYRDQATCHGWTVVQTRPRPDGPPKPPPQEPPHERPHGQNGRTKKRRPRRRARVQTIGTPPGQGNPPLCNPPPPRRLAPRPSHARPQQPNPGSHPPHPGRPPQVNSLLLNQGSPRTRP